MISFLSASFPPRCRMPILIEMVPWLNPRRCCAVIRQCTLQWPDFHSDLSGRAVVMPTGTVLWFEQRKGFGFIQPDDGGKDVFVHISVVERAGLGTLREGQKIGYEIVADRRSGKSSADNLRAAG